MPQCEASGGRVPRGLQPMKRAVWSATCPYKDTASHQERKHGGDPGAGREVTLHDWSILDGAKSEGHFE